jgi:anti-repressor protein
MNQLISITENNGNKAVSARELHEFLEVKTDFTDWIKRMLEYGFSENEDYSLLKIGERNAHNKTDYALTLDCAKEISMLQRTDKGKEARMLKLLI